MPSRELTDDLDLLLRVMPPHLRDSLHRQSDLKNLVEVLKQHEEIAQASKDPYLIAWVTGSGGANQYFLGRFRLAAEMELRALATFAAETTGTSWEIDAHYIVILPNLGRYKHELTLGYSFKFTDNKPETLHKSWSTPPEGASWPRLGSCFAPDESTA